MPFGTGIFCGASAFALTSLDSVARVGRLSLQEFFMEKDREMVRMAQIFGNKRIATVFTLALVFLLAKVGYESIRPLFDSGNVIQLVFTILLLVLGVMVAVEGLQKLFGKRK